MSGSGSNHETLKFRDVTLDLRAGRVLRDGVDLRLAPQPLQLLIVLARRPGELVTHSELRDAIWEDRHVEFEQSLRFAVRKLRQALGDDDPLQRIIETVPRQGYRLAVEIRAASESPSVGVPVPTRLVRPIAIAALLAASAVAAVWIQRRPEPLKPDLVVGFAGVQSADALRSTDLTAGLREAMRASGTVRLVPPDSADAQLRVTIASTSTGTEVRAALHWRGEGAPRWHTVITSNGTEPAKLSADLAADVGAAAHAIRTGGTAPGEVVTVERTPGAPPQ